MPQEADLDFDLLFSKYTFIILFWSRQYIVTQG